MHAEFFRERDNTIATLVVRPPLSGTPLGDRRFATRSSFPCKTVPIQSVSILVESILRPMKGFKPLVICSQAMQLP
jgi:hypothetical protein